MGIKLGGRYRYTYDKAYQDPEREEAHSGEVVRVLRPSMPNDECGARAHLWWVVHTDGFINLVDDLYELHPLPEE